MNKHDQQRRDQCIKSLLKSKKKLETACLYLTVNSRNITDVFPTEDALEHVNIALERLGVNVDAGE
jgi:hypothetical protein